MPWLQGRAEQSGAEQSWAELSSAEPVAGQVRVAGMDRCINLLRNEHQQRHQQRDRQVDIATDGGKVAVAVPLAGQTFLCKCVCVSVGARRCSLCSLARSCAVKLEFF